MYKCILAAVVAAMVLGCSSTSKTDEDMQTVDLAQDVAGELDTPEVKIVSDVVDTVDVLSDFPDILAPDVPRVMCNPGEGCFLDECTENEDCQSGWCVEHLGGKVCSQTCQEECPVGWVCTQVATGGPDLNYVCVSAFPSLCRPCTEPDDCAGTAGTEDACVSYGNQGAFCGGACGEEGQCPAGFECRQVQTVDGIELKQCVPDDWQCSCTDTAVQLGLFTMCQATSEFGICEGKRVCTEEGLTDCDAMTPANEQCNGIDDDCDGDVDEPFVVQGDFVNLCNDDNKCTDDKCAGEQGCVNEIIEETICDDGNPCTTSDACAAGTCLGEPVDCDDENPCTDDACNGTGTCEHPANTAPCDDSDPCTAADLCQEGQCSGTSVFCDCQIDDDCAALEDGDSCNGTLVCDLGVYPYRCKVDPTTVVTCPEPEGENAFCLAVACDPATGTCLEVPHLEGFLCDDADACTVNEKCGDGVCVAGVAVNCNDGNLCTDDTCDAAFGCVHTPNSAECDDGNLCTVGDACAQEACAGGELALDCSDGDLCTEDSCDSQAGCVHESKVCDDGDLCTLDTCLPSTGFCIHTVVAVSCGPCTASVCDPETGLASCQEVECDDGDACTLDLCLPADGKCKHAAVVCDDSNPCTDDWCDPELGCRFEANAVPCSDDDACTSGDVCSGSACLSGTQINCNDGNGCTDDSCEPAVGCIQTHNTSPCNDGDVCTVGDACLDGECQAGQDGLDCDDGNECTDDSCASAAGCVHAANLKTCDDGNLCTTGDFCSGGQCHAGAMEDCDDGNPCTKDLCLVDAGCVYDPADALCSDGDACTWGDHCADKQCVFAGPLDCDDGNACTDDSCDSESGCVNTPNQAGCDDKDACTLTDVCVNGECVGSNLDLCDDENVCTDDYCDMESGCVNAANQAGCDDDNQCTLTDACVDGACVGSDLDPCDDGNVCTDDSCDSESGCVNTPNQAVCDDSNACTATDVCVDGECVGSDEQVCEDDNPCTVDSCGAQGCEYLFSGPCTVQPGPAEGMDHVIGSVYNIDPSGTMDHIRTGGWGDNYWALLQFPLAGLPPVASKATVRLFGMNDNNNPTSMYFDRVTSSWAENCTWSQKPSTVNITSIPPSQVGVWYEIDVTALYNGWRSGAYPNYGVEFRSHGTSNNYNGFWSSDYDVDPSLRPMLVVEPAE